MLGSAETSYLARVALAFAVAAAFAIGCGDDGSQSVDSGDDVADAAVPDLVPADQGNDAPDPVDVRGDAGQDAVSDGLENDATDAVEPLDAVDAVEDQFVPADAVDGEIQAVDDALDGAFLVPNHGLAMKMVTRLLAEYPASGLQPGDTAQVLSAELLLPSGGTVRLEDAGSAFATLYPMDGYDDSWVFINAAGTESDQSHRYTLNLYPALSILTWMKDTGLSDISGDYAQFIIYREGWFNGAYVSCPAITGASPSLSQMRVHFDPETLEAGRPLGFMINSYVTDDRKAITTMYGAASYSATCTCYDVSGDSYTERACADADIDQYPGAARAVAPYDGEEGVESGGAVLQWTSSGDPDGGAVTYDLYFGEDPDHLSVLHTGVSFTQAPVDIVENATFYWRVDVRDDEGNLVRGPVWTFNTDASVPDLEPHNYLILVDKRLKGQLDDELSGYLADIGAQEPAIVPAIRYWMPGDHVAMRQIILDSRDNHCVAEGDCLQGVFLIGDLPSAWYEQDSDYGGDIGIIHEEFPTELFFEDLDCGWTDADGNGIYDGHGGLALEIFTSRLVGDVARMKAYFARLHEYRTGGPFFSPRNFFSFVDDDWNGANAYGVPDGSTTGQKWGLEAIYGDNYIRREWEDDTDKTDYLEVMSGGGAEFVYQWIHSDPQQIYFDDNFSPNPENILTLQEVAAAGVQGSFFNLFDCSISRYTESEGNIASEYLYSDKGLATIGSTKTGGIFNPEVLHGAMLDGVGVGPALRLWFDDTWTNREAYGLPDPTFDDWWLGMMVQGDPLVLLNPDAAARSVRSASTAGYPLAGRVFDAAELQALYEIMGRKAVTTRVEGRTDYLRHR